MSSSESEVRQKDHPERGCENLCIDTSAGCLFGQGACLTCLLYVRDVQVFPEQSSMFFFEVLFCRRSELA